MIVQRNASIVLSPQHEGRWWLTQRLRSVDGERPKVVQ